MSFSFSKATQTEAQGSLCWVICYILSATSQVPNSIGVPEGPLRPGVAFLTTSHPSSSPTLLELQLAWLLSWLSYIIVQRPLDRPLDLWNCMFNRHQAEITVMQFRGHSLPVRQSMRASWDFFTLSHFISQFPPMRFPLITAIIICHFLPVHHLEWHFGPGQRSKCHNTQETPFWGIQCILSTTNRADKFKVQRRPMKPRETKSVLAWCILIACTCASICIHLNWQKSKLLAKLHKIANRTKMYVYCVACLFHIYIYFMTNFKDIYIYNMCVFIERLNDLWTHSVLTVATVIHDDINASI